MNLSKRQVAIALAAIILLFSATIVGQEMKVEPDPEGLVARAIKPFEGCQYKPIEKSDEVPDKEDLEVIGRLTIPALFKAGRFNYHELPIASGQRQFMFYAKATAFKTDSGIDKTLNRITGVITINSDGTLAHFYASLQKPVGYVKFLIKFLEIEKVWVNYVGATKSVTYGAQYWKGLYVPLARKHPQGTVSVVCIP